MSGLNNNQIIPIFEKYCRQNQIDGKKITGRVGDKNLILKVCSTPESLSKGYSGSQCPSDKEGMIFVYQADQILEFWMKDVNFALDIMFFDSAMNLVDHLTMDPCGDLTDDDLPRYRSSAPAMYAVEVCGGWCKSNGIDQNCRLKF